LRAERARRLLRERVAVALAVGGAHERGDDLEVPLGHVGGLAPEVGEAKVDVQLEQVDPGRTWHALSVRGGPDGLAGTAETPQYDRRMGAVLLALASSLTWGVADFAGGVLTRRLPLAAVTLLSQSAGFALLLVLVAATRDVDAAALWLGALAGVGGGAGLACFYAALARGTMSIVSPVAACSAVVPAGGRRAGARGQRDAVPLAVGAALAFGVFVFFLGRAARDGSALSALVGARLGSLGLLGSWALVTGATLRVAAGALPAVAAVGLADVAANALFALASQRGLLAVVSVLGSLYPVVTVLLAHLLLAERLSPLQRAGVVVALAGVATVSATSP